MAGVVVCSGAVLEAASAALIRFEVSMLVARGGGDGDGGGFQGGRGQEQGWRRFQKQ